MREKQFNLVDSPWILVKDQEEHTEEVSLEEVLINAQDYRCLSGETAAQDAAIRRFLVAINHAVITEMSPRVEDEEEALDRWEEIWKEGKLPEQAIKEYLARWKDKFWLIDPDGGFLQSKTAAIGTDYKAPKLTGDLAESNNKLRLFQLRSGEAKEGLSMAEAARWLLNVNAYDDTSAKAKGTKPNGEKFPSIGAGWLGKLGQIYAQGRNLFETIMLNTVLLKEDGTRWGPDKPYWEVEESEPIKQRESLSIPDNQAGLLTFPSRLLLLKEQDGRITGFNLLGGGFFDKTDAFNEPFTIWRPVKGKKNDPVHFVPRRHNSSRQIWRDFSSIAGFGKEKEGEPYHLPGIITWIKTLKSESLIPDSQLIEFNMPFVQYGDKDFFVTDTSSQSLVMYPLLLTEAGVDWRTIIEEEINKIDKAANAAGRLAETTAMASGNSSDSVSKCAESGRTLAYEAADQPFRTWLASLDPKIYADEATRQKKREELQIQLRRCLLRLERRIVGSPPVNALFSREIMEGGKKVRVLSIPEAEMRFESQINKLYPKLSSKKVKQNGKEK
ncbi:type I-E CRISPR-associated protein Cse1/CasA [uncultured Faecalibaculum sp.]|uniref:type I-E CRISPR-associated protein Cse1/CasA n=1 Tax=uncultured Faecalibaculum sp. TaxID=1729681 RepID=UPI00272EB29B|nr:type I-E CRISPR-associated protein Cse1/CasA [uncultured Faecalibaculum sp.]